MHQTKVYLMRKLGWTVEQIDQFTLEELVELADEVAFQDSLERYEVMSGFAMIAATIVNTTPRKTQKKYKVRDFIGDAPKRKRTEQRIMEDARTLAEKMGYVGPPA